ncbi:uncharacterized protein SETTUDRAFT_25435 [Exserohilum turcica Et28A]|uniref:Uncharacterized protein n=1 Tax=Exserohilum turcicum (strain 28A) TaxID=671987 RepID=R0KM39_EXST2|nr:uncharacterized protein SETTUDRAFT_25435 [Exserohilum turcica Et28A]EOA90149.1 hypothetical protein SETTUDRAFT_25435 [Exserohilum turcica Et28A]
MVGIDKKREICRFNESFDRALVSIPRRSILIFIWGAQQSFHSFRIAPETIP